MKPYLLLPLVLVVLGAAPPPASVSRRGVEDLLGVPNTWNPFPDYTLDVQVGPTYPAGLPILLTIKLTNQGKTPLTYWCGGPGRYPPFRGVRASVTLEGGKPTLAPLSNGQYERGSGQIRQIIPSESMQIPGVLPPLSKGSYTIQIGNAKSVHVKVTDDPALLKKREADLLAGIRKGDPVYPSRRRTGVYNKPR